MNKKIMLKSIRILGLAICGSISSYYLVSPSPTSKPNTIKAITAQSPSFLDVNNRSRYLKSEPYVTSQNIIMVILVTIVVLIIFFKPFKPNKGAKKSRTKSLRQVRCHTLSGNKGLIRKNRAPFTSGYKSHGDNEYGHKTISLSASMVEMDHHATPNGSDCVLFREKRHAKTDSTEVVYCERATSFHGRQSHLEASSLLSHLSSNHVPEMNGSAVSFGNRSQESRSVSLQQGADNRFGHNRKHNSDLLTGDNESHDDNGHNDTPLSPLVSPLPNNAKKNPKSLRNLHSAKDSFEVYDQDQRLKPAPKLTVSTYDHNQLGHEQAPSSYNTSSSTLTPIPEIGPKTEADSEVKNENESKEL